MRKGIPCLCLSFLLILGLSLQAQVKQDSVYVGQGVAGTADFRPARRSVVLAHDAEGRPLQIVNSRRAGNAWVPASRRQFAYEEGQISALRVQRWNPTTESFRDQELRVFNYEANGTLRRRVYAVAPQPGASLVNDRRWTYEYDGEERLMSILFEQWGDGEWVNSRRQLYRYQGDGLLEEQLGQRWQDGNWQNDRRRLMTYEATYQGLATILGQQWSENDANWVNTKRMEYEYTPNGLAASERTQNWNAAAQEWENDNRQLFTMGTQGQFEGRLRQVWQEGDWQNQFRGVQAFTNRTLSILFEAWEDELEQWQMHSRHQLQYDTDGLLTQSQGWQRWNEETSTWLNLRFTRRYRYFWSDVLNSIRPAPQPSACRTPNPYPLGAAIVCENLPAQSPLQVELFDLVGRPVLAKTVAYDQQISLNQTLPAGMYFLRIHQGDQLVHLEQLVIAQ